MKLERIAFLGRTYAEYLDMFGLSEDDLRGMRILDCPAGPSSFAAEARERGISVTAGDVLFDLNPDELRTRGQDDIAHVFDAFDKVSDNYQWTYYKDRDRVVEHRQRALDRFVRDYSSVRQAGEPGRYVSASLEGLPFGDGEFSLCLSGHFLFLYGQWLSIDQHVAALREMMRVAKESRVYPIKTIDGNDYDFMGYIISTLADEGIRAEIDEVPMHFMKGANKALRLTHAF